MIRLCFLEVAGTNKPVNFNPLNAELNPICHLLALFGDHHILHVSRILTNGNEIDAFSVFSLDF